jgi:acyl-CoA synthetase (NDP forming)
MQTSPIPIVPVLSSLTSCESKIAEFIRRGNVYFPDEVELGRALGKVANWVAPEDAPPAPDGYDRAAIGQALGDQHGALTPESVGRVLQAAGFRLPGQIEVFQPERLTAACRQVGFPLAMKVIGLLHKTDAGGVRLGIADAGQALAAWEDLLRIPDARGVLIQPMVGGLEVILGASREGEFGHLVMFGLGGIYTEVLKDVTFALAPLTRNESLRMIRGIRSYAVLEGVRGGAGMDMEVLADYLQRLGRLVGDFPRIKEIDLNPVKGFGGDLYAVDARIIVQV